MKVVFDRWAISTQNPLITQLVEPPPEKEAAPKSDEPSAKIRTFTDKSGKFSVEATFLGVKNNKVGLKTMSGEVVAIPLDSLSDGDVEWIKRTAMETPQDGG